MPSEWPQFVILLPSNLLTRHPSHKICLSDVEGVGRCDARKHIERARYDSGPAGLVAGSQPGAIVPVEVFVEQNVVLPVRIVLELLSSAVYRPSAVGIAEENARQPASKLFSHLEQRHEFHRASGTFELKVIAVELVKVQ